MALERKAFVVNSFALCTYYMLATAIGIDAAVEGQVGRVVVRDHAFGRIQDQRRLERWQFIVQPPVVRHALALLRVVAADHVQGRAAALAAQRRQDDLGWRVELVVHSRIKHRPRLMR